MADFGYQIWRHLFAPWVRVFDVGTPRFASPFSYCVPPRRHRSDRIFMNQSQLRTWHPAVTGRRLASAISLLLLGLVVVVVLFVTIRSPMKDDVAWLLYVARRWMAGRELYVDVVEVN